MKTVGTGVLGLLLAGAGVGAGASPAAARGGGGPFGADGDTRIIFRAGFTCEGRARTCVNGPVNSGNSSNTQNVRLNGNPSSSGSPTNNAGSVNSGSTGTGAAAGSSNEQQSLDGGGDMRF
ncbi:hypothetical protein GCM10010315_25450 [Streptomyces luteosporeus]|uniref:DUF320 domain-containing protein n=2 Tax=Streptomyces TaxID=1883 RepID=A0ABN3TRN7_9ACTN